MFSCGDFVSSRFVVVEVGPVRPSEPKSPRSMVLKIQEPTLGLLLSCRTNALGISERKLAWCLRAPLGEASIIPAEPETSPQGRRHIQRQVGGSWEGLVPPALFSELLFTGLCTKVTWEMSLHFL